LEARQAAVMLSDPESFRAFYVEALPRVYSYVLHRCGGSPQVAEDLTQETFMAAVKEIRRRNAVGSPIAWILGIARHKLIDHYRAREREERKLEAIQCTAGPEDFVMWEGEQSRERALAALGAIPGPQRAALVLRYLDGLSVPDVARILGKSIRHRVTAGPGKGRIQTSF
jgi:RNA polymerase sigma-70 factor (ECF subfamily)